MLYSVLYKSVVTATFEDISVVARDQEESWDLIQKKIQKFKSGLIAPLTPNGRLQFGEADLLRFREEFEVKLVIHHGPVIDLLLIDQEDGLNVARSLEGTQDWDLLEKALSFLGLDLQDEMNRYADEQWEREEEARRTWNNSYDDIPY